MMERALSRESCEISRLELAWEEEEEEETRRKKGMRDYDSSWLFRRGDNGWGRCRAAGEREKAGDRPGRLDLGRSRERTDNRRTSNVSSRNRRSREISTAGWKSRRDPAPRILAIDDCVPRRGRKMRGWGGDTLILCISVEKKKSRDLYTRYSRNLACLLCTVQPPRVQISDYVHPRIYICLSARLSA